jgi:hypothetical protein
MQENLKQTILKKILLKLWDFIPVSIRRGIYRHFLFIKKSNKFDLVILDDLLPIPLSPWRNHEYESLLKQYLNSKVVLDFSSYGVIKVENTYNQQLNELKKMYPLLANKLVRLKLFTSINTKLFYTLFYNNIYRYYPYLKYNKIN